MKKMLRVVQGQKRRNDPSKTDWVRLGIGFSDSKGIRLKLNALPLQDENGEVWVSLFEDDGSDKPQQRQPQAQSGGSGLNDEIPF
jgi:hypothetical protein